MPVEDAGGMGIPPVGLLVIRAWLEEGSERPLRVEVRMTTDSAYGFERELVFSVPEPVAALVPSWLEELVAAGTEPPVGRP
jgi:hypothetical protein